jgi:hypothetical protein
MAKLPWRGTPEQLQTLEQLGPDIVEMQLRGSPGAPLGTVAIGEHINFTRDHVHEWLAEKLAQRKADQDKQQADMAKAVKWSARATVAAAIAAFIAAGATCIQAYTALVPAQNPPAAVAPSTKP